MFGCGWSRGPSTTGLGFWRLSAAPSTQRAIDLAGWTLRDKTGYTYTFNDDVLLGAGKKLTIRSGQGNDGTSSVFRGRRAYVWNNDTDTAYIRNSSARLIDSCSCNSTRADWINCE
ncbi:lamin tail domain-containing protein [Streptosporangium sp. NPDC003464]